jgi:hypothetical protein
MASLVAVEAPDHLCFGAEGHTWVPLGLEEEPLPAQDVGLLGVFNAEE